MNEITNWMQSNWYSLGNLLAQFMLLFAGVWFARKILRSLRATQQQFGALLKLSMSDGLQERVNESEATHSPTPSVVAGGMFTPPMERPTAPAHSSAAYTAFERPTRSEAPAQSEEWSGHAGTNAPIAPTIEATEESTPYVSAPLTLPADEHSGGAIRGVVRWLQTPMPTSSTGSSPWRRVVRWLQAPARS